MSTVSKSNDQRGHVRFNVGAYGIAKARFGDGPWHTVHDICFSGFRIQSKPPLTNDIVELAVMGHSVVCNVAPIRQMTGMRGFQFLHRTPAVLVFLQPYLECLRNGAALRRLASSPDENVANGATQVLMNGKDGPTDLALELDPALANVASFILTFPCDGAYWQLRYENGGFQITKQLDQEGIAHDFQPGPLQADIMRFGLTVLAGIPDADIARLMPSVIALGMKELQIF